MNVNCGSLQELESASGALTVHKATANAQIPEQQRRLIEARLVIREPARL